MKNKKTISLLMAAILALGAVPGVSVWAEEQGEITDNMEADSFSALDESEVTDVDENELVSNIDEINENELNGFSDKSEPIDETNSEFTDEIVEETNDIIEYQTNIGTGQYEGHTTNIIEPNRNYKMNEMCRSYDYYLEIDFPVSGRAKIIISNVTKLEAGRGDDWAFDSGTESNSGNYEINGVNDKDSGWISVKSGKAIFTIFSKWRDINKEAQVLLRYEKAGQYVGEVEDNDTFDTANIIENNVIYEGNSSKENYIHKENYCVYGDEDYYKFEMKQSGLAEIVSNNCRYVLYEEDENNNVYQIADCNSNNNDFRKYTNRVRLSPGYYYLLMNPNRGAGYREYSFSVNTTYESPEDFEQEDNNVKSTANEKKTNHWYTGNMNTEEDIDCFKMTILEDSFLSIEFKVPRQIQNDTLKIGLYDSSMENVLSEASNTENPYLKTKEIFCPAGVYYVRVERASKYSELTFFDDYSFNLNQRQYKYVTNLKLPEAKVVTEGKDFTFNPVFTPSDADNKGLKWSSSNQSVAKVDQKGNVTTGKCGTAIITAIATDQNKISSSCVVTVCRRIKYVLNGGINNGANFDIYAGHSFILKNPQKRGYIFRGWYSDKSYQKRITKITSENSQEGIICAKWEKIKLGKVDIISFANKSGKKGLVKYKAVSGAAGYEIVYSTDKKVKKNCTSIRTRAKSRTLKNLKKGRTYYVKVRAYKTDSTGRVVYGKYSAIKKVKIKK